MRTKKEFHFQDYLRLLTKYKFFLLFCIASFLGPTYWFVQRIPDYYIAGSEMVIDEKRETFSLMERTASNRTLSYYRAIFEGQAFQEKVLMALDTARIPGVGMGTKRDFLRSAVTLAEGSTNQFIRVQTKTTSQELSYELAKSVTDSLVVFCRRVENEEAERGIQAIRDQIRVCEVKRDEIQKDKNGFTDVAKLGTSGDFAGLKALEKSYQEELVKYELEKANFQAKLSYFEQLDAEVQKQSKGKNDGQLVNLRKRLQQLEEEKEKRVRLGVPVSPGSKLSLDLRQAEEEIIRLSKGNREQDLELLNQWQSIRKEVSKQESDLELKEARLRSFKKAILAYRSDHPNLGKHEFEIQRLDNLLNRYTEAHQRLTEKLEEAVIRTQSVSGGLKLVDAAQMPGDPIPRKDYVFYVIALILGAGIGFGISLLREWMDNTIKSPDDIEKVLALPLLGTIPHIELRKGDLTIRRKVTAAGNATMARRYPFLLFDDKQGRSIAAEAYRSLRTNILFASPDKPIQTFLVTSSGPGEGKSLSMANLALTFAQQGEPTLLVDTDLRRPVCHHLFGLSRSPGFGNLFAEGVSVEDVIRPVGQSSLMVMTAGTYIPNPAELLGSKRMDALIDELKQKFRYVLFDTPPVIAVTDSCLLATKLDCVLLVARAGTTTLEAAERTLQSLNQVNANLLGFVLNDVDFSSGYNNYGYYKHYHHYYHASAD